MRVSIVAAIAALWLGQANAATVNLTYSSGPLQLAKSCVTDLLSGCAHGAHSAGVPVQRLSYRFDIALDDSTAVFVDGHARFDLFDGTVSLGGLKVFSEDGGTPVEMIGDQDSSGLAVLDFWVQVDTAYNLTDMFLLTELEADPTGADLPSVWAALYVDYYPANTDPTVISGPVVSLWFANPNGGDRGTFGLYRADAPSPVPLPATAPLLALALAGGWALRRRA